MWPQVGEKLINCLVIVYSCFVVFNDFASFMVFFFALSKCFLLDLKWV